MQLSSTSTKIKLIVIAVLLLSWSSDALQKKEPRTGIVFPDPYLSKRLQKAGVRTKGPVKVYAVGQYGDSTFLLQMTYGVGAEKMTKALKEALEPRLNGGSDGELEQFEQLMLRGLPKGAPKGTQMTFGTGGGKLSLQVNGKNIGSIGSKALAKAFAGIYTDRKAVCALKAPAIEEEDDECSSDFQTCVISKLTSLRVGGAGVGAVVGYGIGSFFSKK